MKDIERFVEAHFLGVDISEALRTVKLTFREPSGRYFFLSAFGLHRLLISEYRETNIVDRLNFWDSSAAPENYRNALCSLVSGDHDWQRNNWIQVIEMETKAVRYGTRIFIEIEAVYGAQVLMLAKSIGISE